MIELKIDPEFKKLIPPLSLDELHTLEENLVAHGCRDALVTWDGFLIDGHNRYAICRQYGLKFATVEMEFEDRDDVLIWIMRNQLGRRNLTDFSRAELALKLESTLHHKAKESQLGGLSQYRGATSCTTEKTSEIREVSGKTSEQNPNTGKKTRDVVGEIAGVSGETIRRAKVVIENADEETKDELRSGKTSISKVYKEIKAKKDKDASVKNHMAEGDGEQEPEELTPLSQAIAGLERLKTMTRQLRNAAKEVFAFNDEKCPTAPYLTRFTWISIIGTLSDYLTTLEAGTPTGGTPDNPTTKRSDQMRKALNK